MSTKYLTKEKFLELKNEKMTEEESFKLDRKIIREAQMKRNCCRIIETYQFFIFSVENDKDL